MKYFEKLQRVQISIRKHRIDFDNCVNVVDSSMETKEVNIMSHNFFSGPPMSDVSGLIEVLKRLPAYTIGDSILTRKY